MKPVGSVQESHGRVRVPGQQTLSRRIAAAVVQMAHRFESDILLCAGSLCIDAKSSMMALMLLAASKGQLLDLTARGVDSDLAIQTLTRMFHRS